MSNPFTTPEKSGTCSKMVSTEHFGAGVGTQTATRSTRNDLFATPEKHGSSSVETQTPTRAGNSGNNSSPQVHFSIDSSPTVPYE